VTMRAQAHNPVITVGVDGSSASDAALAWAVAEARLWDGTIDAVHVCRPSAALGWPDRADGYYPGLPELREVVHAALIRVGPPDDLPIAVNVRMGRPAAGLRDEALQVAAALTVVGRSQRRPFLQALLGSVDHALSGIVASPVVVVPAGWTAVAATGWILVGVDGTARGAAALDWAIAEASRRHADVRALLVWDESDKALSTGAVPVTADDEPTPDQQARHRLETAIREARSPLERQPAVTIASVAVRGAAREEFLRQALHADLVVLGGHYRRTLVEFLSGSTTRSCVADSPTPVVVVPEPKR
jgi:nucleotide-binding universal stress UspA family protein